MFRTLSRATETMTISKTGSFAALLVVLVGSSCLNGTSGKFFYELQDEWASVPATPTGTNQCNGDLQSPVNLNTDDYTCKADATPYSLYSGDCTLGDYEFTINDHGVKASVEKATCQKPKMIIPGSDKVYEVLQFHIHTGCENMFNGTGCDADLHMVHIAKTDVALPAAASNVDLPDLAVLGLMMHGVDKHSDEMQPLVDSWMQVSCSNGSCAGSVPQELKDEKFSPYDLVPAGTAVYNFKGSLTTPPCWEVVNWNVVEKPLLMSFRQMLVISNLINKYKGHKQSDGTCTNDQTVASDAGLTAREIQPLNGRQVVKNCAPISMMTTFPDAAQVDTPSAQGTGTDGGEKSSANSNSAFSPFYAFIVLSITALFYIL